MDVRPPIPVLATVGGKLATVQHDPNPDPVETAKAHAGGPAWKAPRKKVLWGDKPHCPRCGSVEVARKDDEYRIGRWNCHGCKSSFNVPAGTVFQKTKVPLQKWFLAIAPVPNAKKSLSGRQLFRDLDLN